MAVQQALESQIACYVTVLIVKKQKRHQDLFYFNQQRLTPSTNHRVICYFQRHVFHLRGVCAYVFSAIKTYPPNVLPLRRKLT